MNKALLVGCTLLCAAFAFVGAITLALAPAHSMARDGRDGALQVYSRDDALVIRGCLTEDGCYLDYRFGDRWVIRPDRAF